MSPRRAEGRAQALAERMGFRFDWNRSAESLGPGGAQKLEILKLLWRETRIMILGEPTAMLSPADASALFVSLRTLTEAGATVLLVTHRLPEVLDHAERVTVLRAGQRVADVAVADTSGPELARAIIGGDPRRTSPDQASCPERRCSGWRGSSRGIGGTTRSRALIWRYGPARSWASRAWRAADSAALRRDRGDPSTFRWKRPPGR